MYEENRASTFSNFPPKIMSKFEWIGVQSFSNCRKNAKQPKHLKMFSMYAFQGARVTLTLFIGIGSDG